MSHEEAGRIGAAITKEFWKQKRLEREAEYYLNPRKCKVCDNPIPYKNRNWAKFCGHRCSALFSNSHRIRKRLKTRCTRCSILFVPAVKEYGPSCPTCVGLPRIRTSFQYKRECIFKEAQGKCSKCLLSVWNGRPMPLEIDHIDGNNENNDMSNLRVLCPNCHAQTDTYKGRNVGKTSSLRSAKRRARYAAGKTY